MEKIFIVSSYNKSKELLVDIAKKVETMMFLMEKPLNKLILINTINSYIIHRRRYNYIIEENERLKKENK